jgi:hypothetical protein
MRLWITIGLWVACILFPLAWLGTLSPASKEFIDWIMTPEWLHITMHLIIFAGLVILIMINQRRAGKEISFTALILIILAVGVIQELLQYASDENPVSLARTLSDSAFDLMIDLAGGMLGLGVYVKLLDRGPNSISSPVDSSHGKD